MPYYGCKLTRTIMGISIIWVYEFILHRYPKVSSLGEDMRSSIIQKYALFSESPITTDLGVGRSFSRGSISEVFHDVGEGHSAGGQQW